MVNTIILGGSGRDLTKILSRDFPSGITKRNKIIRAVVRIRNRYPPNKNVEGYNYVRPFFPCNFLSYFRLGVNIDMLLLKKLHK
jgi:hypothetical protein